MIVLPINLTKKNHKILTISLPARSRPPNPFFRDFGSLPNHIQKIGFCQPTRSRFLWDLGLRLGYGYKLYSFIDIGERKLHSQGS